VEAVFQFRLPLIDEVRRAEDGAAGDFATVEEFSNNEPGFDGFSNSDVVGDEETDDRQAQGHQEWDQLVGAGLNGDVAEGAERAGSIAEFQVDGIAQKDGGLVAAVARWIRQREDGRFGWGEFQIRQDESDVFFGATEWAQRQGVGGGAGLDDPLAATGADECSG
jgi:hypothetical protein